MEALWAQLSGTVRQLGQSWTTTTALGSFALYLFGYLSLRFRLTALGIGTYLDFVDERYLFEGVRFATYLVAITVVRLPQWSDPEVAKAAGFRSIGDGRTGVEHFVNQAFMEDDQFLKSEPARVAEAMVNSKTTLVTLRESDGAGEHCHMGAMGRTHQLIFDWLDDILAQTV